MPSAYFNNTSKPYVRWWWLAGPFCEADIVSQLDWLKANGFGGVELAWLRPSWCGLHDEPEPAWLGYRWSRLTAFAKQYAQEIGLGCDFTFGSSWPFGGACVSMEYALHGFDGPRVERVWGSWDKGSPYEHRVLNHLNGNALRNYASALMPAFSPALAGSTSALFCDSLELDTPGMWSPQLWDAFEERFGYSLREYTRDLDELPDVRYDYRKIVSEAFIREFFEAFTAICHENGAISRVQCHGSPTDLLSAYSAVDIPESEALLFEPHFSRIPASAAALSGKPIVSAEMFTDIYGNIRNPDESPRYWKEEAVADLKLLADAAFANGVNQVVWHGMPYKPPGSNVEFFAAVHVGPDAGFADQLLDFNAYLERISSELQLGRPYTNLAVYLPNEDNWMADRIPREQRTPGAVFKWEMRHVVVPSETEGYHPLWISLPFLKQAKYVDGEMRVGEAAFSSLYIDCEWLDVDALIEILRLAEEGLPVVLKRCPKQPGRNKSDDYEPMLKTLSALPNVGATMEHLQSEPLLKGADLPLYWARQTDEYIYVFFAHPLAHSIKYPMQYGQSHCSASIMRKVTVCTDVFSRKVQLEFGPCESLMIRVEKVSGELEFVDIEYDPLAPDCRK